jgi:hypothetical protein
VAAVADATPGPLPKKTRDARPVGQIEYPEFLQRAPIPLFRLSEVDPTSLRAAYLAEADARDQHEQLQQNRFKAMEIIEAKAQKNSWIAVSVTFVSTFLLAVVLKGQTPAAGAVEVAMSFILFIIIVLKEGDSISPRRSGLNQVMLSSDADIKFENVIEVFGTVFERWRLFIAPWCLGLVWILGLAL